MTSSIINTSEFTTFRSNRLSFRVVFFDTEHEFDSKFDNQIVK